MINKETLIADGFTLEQYSDGKFWLLRAHSDLFIQVSEDLTDITLYQNGWVDNNLTDAEYCKSVDYITNYKDEE